MGQDIAVGSVGIPAVSPGNKKPPYLTLLDLPGSKGKNCEKFISIDKPELLSGFIQAKGFFCADSEDDIMKNISELLTTTKKELYVEMMFPAHRIISIKNLVFKAK